MLDATVISGAGGGGKSGGSGGGLNETPDSLRSTSYAQVLDLISEGEIVGLVDGLKSIYVDDTPVQNADGSLNFKDVQYVATTGTQSQPAINGFDTVRSEIVVAIEAKAGVPVVRSITNSNVSSVAVTIEIPQLTNLDDKGNLGGTTVEYAIDIENNGGGFVEVVNQKITAKSSSAYDRQHRIKLPAGGPWKVQLRRITPDSTKSSLANKTFLKSYTEIIEAKLRYPNSALIGVRVDASQFRAVPRRGYDVKLLKIRIPTNATVRADGSLSYNGSWDGTFKIAWSTCPAWALYDIFTSNRYGLGDYIPAALIDKWTLYSISKYSNTLVPDGFGGTEPRFSCNIYIDTAQEAYKLISDMSSIFRAMPYWGSGSLTLAQDAPQDPVYLYHNGNVIDGAFTYQGSSAKARHTVALVAWNDPADMYRQKIEYVEDTDGIARYGVIETQVVAVGCTSRGQAHRVGRWTLYSERFETDVVTFRTGGEGLFCTPGSVIKVADQYRAGKRMGGRISAADGRTIVLDRLDNAPTLPAQIYVAGQDGGVDMYNIASVSGRTVTVTGNFVQQPAVAAPWVITSTSLDAQTFRVLAVAEFEDDKERGYEITALAHEPTKYDFIENGIALQQRDFTSLSPVPDAVDAVALNESLYAYQNQIRAKITASWGAAANASAYRVRWRYNSGNWGEATTTSLDYEILDTAVGLYEIEVTAVGVFGTPANASTRARISAVGKTAPPADVVNLVASTDSVIGVTLSWDPVSDLDAAYYEVREGSAWSTGVFVARVSGTSLKIGAVKGGTTYYRVKAVDTSGNYSINSPRVTVSITSPSLPSVTATVVDNNVLLSWTDCTQTLAIDYYEVRRSLTNYAASVPIGKVKSTFMPVFETAAVTNVRYYVVPYDVAGTVGTVGSVITSVNQPPDYSLMLNFDSAFGGTKTSAFLDTDGSLYLPVNTTETYDQHFSTRSWTSWQSAISAGSTNFAAPNPTTAVYEEVIDYGATIPAARITLTTTSSVEYGTATITPKISVSNTASTGPWTDLTGTTPLASNFRWIKIRYDVAASTSNGLIKISGFKVKIDAKQKTDSGSKPVSSADTTGTVISFNTSFISVNSISVTPNLSGGGSSPIYAVCDFDGSVANPTSFKVYLYNSSGTRVSGTVSWNARGY